MNTAVDVIGIGGAGGFLAAALYRGELPPRIISRGAALRQLQQVGLTIVTREVPTVYAPIESQAINDVRRFAPLILLTIKSYDIQALLEEITPRLTSDTLIICVQNGFAAYDAVVKAVGEERAVLGVLYVGANIVSPGVIDVKPGAQRLYIDNYHGEKLEPLVEALRRGGIEAELVADSQRKMWQKQLFLVPFAILNAEMREPIGKVRENPEAREQWNALAKEIASIASACGVALPANAAEASLQTAMSFDPEAHTSFARDVWAGRPNEAQALFGPLLQRGREHSIASPLLQAAYDFYVK